MGIKIVTDSTCYISKDILEKLDISVVSLSVSLDEKTYRETDVNHHDFYTVLAETESFPKSSQPNILEVENTFKNLLEQGNDVIGVFLSSKMSGTYQTANMIAEELKEEYPDRKIIIVDSLTNSMEMGAAVIEGAKLAQEGADMEHIAEHVKDVVKRSRFIFLPENLDYLQRGGRIGKAKALLGNLLKLTPILTVIDGETTILDKVRTKKKAVKKLVDTFLQDGEDKGIEQILVHHIENEKEAKVLASELEAYVNQPVTLSSIGPVIGSHVGPGAIGIVYTTKKNN